MNEYITVPKKGTSALVLMSNLGHRGKSINPRTSRNYDNRPDCDCSTPRIERFDILILIFWFLRGVCAEKTCQEIFTRFPLVL